MERGIGIMSPYYDKYRPGQAEALLEAAGFAPVESWTDERGWFGICLGRKVSS